MRYKSDIRAIPVKRKYQPIGIAGSTKAIAFQFENGKKCQWFLKKIILRAGKKVAMFSGEFGTFLFRVNLLRDLPRSTFPIGPIARPHWRRGFFLGQSSGYA
jgi:hypothetical protein